MKGAFDEFFFDAMNGRFKSLQDVASSALNFIQKLTSNILSTYATNAAMTGLANLRGFFRAAAVPQRW